MNRLLSLIVVLIWHYNGIAQVPRTLDAMKQYYQQNIQKLKPLEGVYDVAVRSYNEVKGTWYSSSHQVAFYYSEDSGKYFEYGIDRNSGKLTEKSTYRYNPQSHILSHYDGFYPFKVYNTDNFDYEEDRRASIWFYYKKNYSKIYPTAEMYAQAAQPQEWSGTGFALKDGYLMTNFHVIDGAGSIYIQGVNGNFNMNYNAIVVSSDRANDIALLKISDGRFTGFGNVPYQLRSTLADVGETVYALGYPLANVMGDEIIFTDGKISSKTGYQGAVNVYQISVPIQPGNSGGPLFDQQGRIVGITTASLNKDMFGSENVNYAVKTGYILNLIDSSVGRNILPTGTIMKNQNLTQQIKTAKNFVFYISCKK